jgi:hypothetical protein
MGRDAQLKGEARVAKQIKRCLNLWMALKLDGDFWVERYTQPHHGKLPSVSFTVSSSDYDHIQNHQEALRQRGIFMYLNPALQHYCHQQQPQKVYVAVPVQPKQSKPRREALKPRGEQPTVTNPEFPPGFGDRQSQKPAEREEGEVVTDEEEARRLDKGKAPTREEDDGADSEVADNRPCAKCGTGEKEDLLICDACEKPYHPKCGGCRYIPKGQWYCDDEECQALKLERHPERRRSQRSASQQSGPSKPPLGTQ